MNIKNMLKWLGIFTLVAFISAYITANRSEN